MAIKRSSTKPHKFTTDVLLNNHLKIFTQDRKCWGLSQVFVMSHANREGITLKPTQKSATASETINALVLVRRFRLLQTRKIVNPFPMMVRNERNQPSIQNQVSMLTVKGSSFSQGQEEGGGGGGVFRNFRVAMCRWNTGTRSLYFCFSWILLPFQTKLPKSLPMQGLLSDFYTQSHS